MTKTKYSTGLAIALALAGCTTAFAAMPQGTVVIGGKAYSLDYANDAAHQDEIQSAVAASGGAVYVKGFDNTWTDNTSGSAAQTSVIPAVTYKGTDGSIVSYAAQDGNTTNTPTTGQAVSTANVTATFSATPAVNVGMGQSLFKVGTITLTADGNAQVNGIDITRTGLSKDSDVKGLTVWDGSNKLNISAPLSNSVANIAFSTPVYLTAGQSKTLDVKLNVASDATGAAQIGFTIPSTSSIKTNGATINGAFPFYTNTFAVASVKLGTLEVQLNNTLTSVDPSSTGNSLEDLTFKSQEEDIKLTRVSLTNNGSIADSDIANLKLVDNTGKTVGTTTGLANRRITFNFDTPITIAKGTSITLTLKGDMVSGSGRNVQFEINDQNDVEAVGATYGTTIVPDNEVTFKVPDSLDGSTEKDYKATDVNPGKLMLSRDASSPAATTVALASTEDAFAALNLQVTGEPTQIRTIEVTGSATGTNTDGSAANLSNLQNLKVMINGAQVGQVSDPFSKGNTESISITPTTVTPGTPTIITIKADVNASGIDKNVVYTLGIGGTGNIIHGVGNVSAKNVDLGSGNDVLGNAMTVGNPQLNVTVVPAGDTSVFQNGASQTLTSFDLSNTLGQPVAVSRLQVLNTGASGTVASDFTNLKLVDSNGNTVTKVITTGTDILAFEFNNPITINQGTSYRVSLVADVKSSAPQGQLKFYVADNSTDRQAYVLANNNQVPVKGSDQTAAPLVKVGVGGAFLGLNSDSHSDLKPGVWTLANSPKDDSNTNYYGLAKSSDITGWNNAAPGAKNVKIQQFALDNFGYEDALVSKITLKLDKTYGDITSGYNSGYRDSLDSQKLTNIRIVDASGKVYGTASYLNTNKPTTITLTTPFDVPGKGTGDNVGKDKAEFAVVADLTSDADVSHVFTIDLANDDDAANTGNHRAMEWTSKSTGTTGYFYADATYNYTAAYNGTTLAATGTKGTDYANSGAVAYGNPNPAYWGVSLDSMNSSSSALSNTNPNYPSAIIGKFKLTNSGATDAKFTSICLQDLQSAGGLSNQSVDPANLPTINILNVTDGKLIVKNVQWPKNSDKLYVNFALTGTLNDMKVPAGTTKEFQVSINQNGYVKANASIQLKLIDGSPVLSTLDYKTEAGGTAASALNCKLSAESVVNGPVATTTSATITVGPHTYQANGINTTTYYATDLNATTYDNLFLSNDSRSVIDSTATMDNVVLDDPNNTK